ncbi:MAG: peptidylprolyl isomerase [Chitinivibrionales bacterium]|nr:peptidylprolyl isomerase [Chitinivibrionales bacterium]MBD3356762.1 peptidylprolyl isomerase [Chitinivibrionales bacterium]
MAKVQNGDHVKINYEGSLGDGTIFDSSEGRDPLEFTVGEHQVIPGVEEAVVGMDVGEKKTVTVPSDQAYGPHMDQLVQTIDKARIPDNVKPEVGKQLLVRDEQGRTLTLQITNIDDKTVTLDANHPLAGQDLTFTLEIVERT